MPGYLTIKGGAGAEFEIKRSRFIASLLHAENAAEAREFILSVKKKYYDARHNPYAYVLGENMGEQKSSDDGEPSGTAGSPILDALVKRGFSNVVVVVTRYFGGIKLGAGGLTRAYGQAACLGLDAAELLSAESVVPLQTTFDYERLAVIERFLTQKNIIVESSDYGEKVTLLLLLPTKTAADLENELVDLTAGRLSRAKFAPKFTLLPLESKNKLGSGV